MLYQLSYVSKLIFLSNNAALLPFYTRAGDGARTRDIKLGRLALYQLSYSRVSCSLLHTAERTAHTRSDGGST